MSDKTKREAAFEFHIKDWSEMNERSGLTASTGEMAAFKDGLNRGYDAAREPLVAVLRDLAKAGDTAYYHLNNTMAYEHTDKDCKLCEVADPPGDALAAAKELIDTEGK